MVFNTIINVSLGEAPSCGGIIVYNATSKGSKSYIKFAQEIINLNQLAKASKKRVLGRGLSAILSDDDNNRFEISKKSYLLNEIEIDKISLNPNQPRTNFNKKSLDELASSINELGLIQPVTVQKIDENFILISEEKLKR